MNWDLIALALGAGIGLLWAFAATQRWPLARWVNLQASGRALSRAIDLRNPRGAGCSRRAGDLAAEAGKRAGLSRERRERMRLAGYLCDIGFAAVPYQVLNTEQSSSVETAVAERHPEIGAAMLDLIPSANEIAELVRLHHARYDQTPDAGEDIHILAAAVSYAGLRGGESARAELTEGRGDRYAPAAVDAVLLASKDV